MKHKIFWIIMLCLAAFQIFITLHELTHLVLATEPTGICFGNCWKNQDIEFMGIPIKYTTMGAAFAKEYFFTNELIPNEIGLAGMFFLLSFGLKYLRQSEAYENA